MRANKQEKGSIMVDNMSDSDIVKTIKLNGQVIGSVYTPQVKK